MPEAEGLGELRSFLTALPTPSEPRSLRELTRPSPWAENSGAGGTRALSALPQPRCCLKVGSWVEGREERPRLCPEAGALLSPDGHRHMPAQEQAGWPGPGGRAPSSQVPLTPGVSKEANHTGSSIAEFKTFHLNPAPRLDPLGCQHPLPAGLCPRHSAGGTASGADGAHTAGRGGWAWALSTGPACLGAPGGDHQWTRRAVGLRPGSHHSLHVQDPQGLGDLGAGVHLAIHAHQEGPVQQHGCVLWGQTKTLSGCAALTSWPRRPGRQAALRNGASGLSLRARPRVPRPPGAPGPGWVGSGQTHPGRGGCTPAGSGGPSALLRSPGCPGST